MNGNTVLALDVGEARIGLARAERGSSFAFGRGWITRNRRLKDDLAELRKLAQEEQAGLLVVGLPRRSDGGESAQTARVREFARQLEEAGFTVEFEDERFTTRIAGQQLLDGTRSKRQRQEKGLLDEAAAVLILETWLQRQAAAGCTGSQTRQGAVGHGCWRASRWSWCCWRGPGQSVAGGCCRRRSRSRNKWSSRPCPAGVRRASLRS